MQRAKECCFIIMVTGFQDQQPTGSYGYVTRLRSCSLLYFCLLCLSCHNWYSPSFHSISQFSLRGCSNKIFLLPACFVFSYWLKALWLCQLQSPASYASASYVIRTIVYFITNTNMTSSMTILMCKASYVQGVRFFAGRKLCRFLVRLMRSITGWWIEELR